MLNCVATKTIVGLPDAAVQESKERVRAAIKNSGYAFPMKRIVVNLAPADLKKAGPAYDLPIAVGILLSSTQLAADISQSLFLGELSLDGSLRHTNGILPMVDMAHQKGLDNIIVPDTKTEVPGAPPVAVVKQPSLDLAHIKGQEHVKRSLEVAAAGGHNVIMCGPPGSGKTLLARALPDILPPMTNKEAIDVTKIYSVSGLLPSDTPLIGSRPFRSPHYTISNAGLVGGGHWPKPGEISLSHRGVLFLDELPEFGHSLLEVLRQPLEDKTVTISRARGYEPLSLRFLRRPLPAVQLPPGHGVTLPEAHQRAVSRPG
jgi:magnesium chelatase family protein